MHPHRLIASLALVLLPLVASAQTSIYSTNFSSGALRTSGTTYNVGDWTLAATKNTLGSSGTGSASLTASGLAFGMGATSSGFTETQNRFTAAPVTLSNVTEYVELKIVFVDNNNVLAGNSGTSSSLAIGLFDSAGKNPAIGLQSSGLTTTASSSFATGNAADWEGYVARIAPTGGSNQIYTRPLQSGAGTTSANQELLYSAVGGGAFTNPVGTSLGSATSTLALLTNGQQYTATFRITLSNTNEYTTLFTLSDAGNIALQSISKTTTGSTFISGLTFDGLSFGYRFNGTSQLSGLTLKTVDVTNLSLASVPEPSSYAMLAGLAGLSVAFARRRRA